MSTSGAIAIGLKIGKILAPYGKEVAKQVLDDLQSSSLEELPDYPRIKICDPLDGEDDILIARVPEGILISRRFDEQSRIMSEFDFALVIAQLLEGGR